MAKKQKFDKGDMYEDVANGDGDSAYEEIQDVMYEGYYETVSEESYCETVQHQSGDYLPIESTNGYLQILPPISEDDNAIEH
jgi:hypothetical protein